MMMIVPTKTIVYKFHSIRELSKFEKSLAEQGYQFWDCDEDAERTLWKKDDEYVMTMFITFEED